MFENTPTATPAPVTPIASNPVAPAGISALSQQDQDAVALFERAKLSVVQKVILLVITSIVVVTVIGVGIWLNSFLPELSSATTTNNATTNAILPPKDSDGDGLTDVDEQQKYHTNANKADSDGDGYVDGEEIKNGYNPNGPGKL